MAGPNPVAESARASSVPAIVTFWLLGIWTLMVLGIFWLVGTKITISVVMFGLLSGVFGTETTLLVGAVGFWVGSSVGAKASGDALAQLAGAGPPPPAAPLAPEPAEPEHEPPADPFRIKP